MIVMIVMTVMKTVKEDNYYIRDDGLIILIMIADVCNRGTSFQYKVIMANCNDYIYGDMHYGRIENFDEYKLIDYKMTKRLDKIISS